MKNDKLIKIVVVSFIVIFLLLIIGTIIIMMMSNNNTENKKTSTNTITEENSIQDSNNIENIDTGEAKIEYIETSDKSKIPLPEGFSYVEGTVSTGAVIEDKEGNQFVWVPTDNILFARRNFDTYNTEISNENEVDVQKAEFSEASESNSEYIESVNKYKGFYIGRYEASENPEDINKACTKKNVMPWTEIIYDKARLVAQNTYKDNTSVQSDIVSSYVWDTLCEWLSKSGYDIYDSTSYGNYMNNTEGTRSKAQTGRNSRWVTNNIYDLAGNVWEISTEEWGEVYDKNHSGRGGGFHNDGIKYPVSCRVAEYDGAYSYIGFRLVLYLR